MNLYSIGFTEKTAERFFGLLRNAGVRRVVDIRLNNRGQLNGFTKRVDLPYFLRELGGIDYVHVPELAPTKPMLDAYKKHHGSWPAYRDAFWSLMDKRRIDQTIARDVIDQGCLLCSEHQPHQCHRTLVAEYLGGKWGGVQATHLT